MLLTLLACSGDGDGLFGGRPGGSDDTGLFVDAPQAEFVWIPDGASWDLATHQGRVVSTTQHGGSIWAFDPGSGEEEEVGADLDEPQAIASDGETLYFTFTDSGQQGSVATLDSKRGYTVLATEGDAGLPMRRMEDMVLSPGGYLVIADPGVEAVWHVETDGSSATAIVQGVESTCVGYHEGQLYVGTEQGVFSLNESSGVLQEIEPIAAYGLFSHAGMLLAGGTSGLREVGGEALVGGLGRAAATVELDGALYITDQATGEVFVAEEL
jgi:outer membrane protein assembly factor BamB